MSNYSDIIYRPIVLKKIIKLAVLNEMRNRKMAWECDIGGTERRE